MANKILALLDNFRQTSPMKKLGILGSGQLARMTAQAANELGVHSRIYCSESPTDLSPAEQVAHKTVKGAISDLNSILKFAEDCDFITLENEFIEQNILEAIDKNFPNRLFPNSKTFKIKVAPFLKVHSKEDVKRFAHEHSYPVVLKSSKGGYDGYGNVTIKNENEIEEKFHLLKGELLVEAFIPYVKELAIMVARNKLEMVTYPIAHTIQENHICHFVSVPAEISTEISERIIEDAKRAMIAIDAIGIFAFEFFLTKEGDLYLNESAPRPHNSGHYSIEGCMTSQFTNHVLSVMNRPLGKTDLLASHVLMLNLLGTKNGEAHLENASDFESIKNGHLHLYGKKMSKIGRKMGHFTLLGNDQNQMMKTLLKLKSEYKL